MSVATKTLVIACGALSREIMALHAANNWCHIDVQCLPAALHNAPGRIPDAVRAKIRASRSQYRSIFVAYGDCGTGGLLDQMLQEERVERIPGAHCYEFFSTPVTFNALSDAEPGSFYLTDFLLRHFDRLVISGLGLDVHPELLEQYFGNYRRLVYLSQIESEEKIVSARAAAARLGLEFHFVYTGYGDLAKSLSAAAAR